MWIALKFFVLLQSKQLHRRAKYMRTCCELLSNFLYFCSRNNSLIFNKLDTIVVNCSQIFCTFAVETTLLYILRILTQLWIALKFFVLLQSKQLPLPTFSPRKRCELLSNFLYFCSRNNLVFWLMGQGVVVNCSQIFCTFAVETTDVLNVRGKGGLWIALKFFVLLQSKQPDNPKKSQTECCELLSNFLYFCSRNNRLYHRSLE